MRTTSVTRLVPTRMRRRRMNCRRRPSARSARKKRNRSARADVEPGAASSADADLTVTVLLVSGAAQADADRDGGGLGTVDVLERHPARRRGPLVLGAASRVWYSRDGLGARHRQGHRELAVAVCADAEAGDVCGANQGEKVCAVWWRQGGDEELRLALAALQRLPAHTGAALSVAEAHLRRTGKYAPIGDAAGSGEAEAGRGDLP